MEGLVRVDVVIVPYPFSDLPESKRGPALVIDVRPGDDVLLSQITSRTIRDADAIGLQPSDFNHGKLSQTSNVRPTRLFTADRRIILYRAGHISDEKMSAVVEAIVRIVRG